METRTNETIIHDLEAALQLKDKIVFEMFSPKGTLDPTPQHIESLRKLDRIIDELELELVKTKEG